MTGAFVRDAEEERAIAQQKRERLEQAVSGLETRSQAMEVELHLGKEKVGAREVVCAFVSFKSSTTPRGRNQLRHAGKGCSGPVALLHNYTTYYRMVVCPFVVSLFIYF